MTTETMIEVAPINTKQAGEYSTKALELTTQAKALTIKNQPDLERAADLRKVIKDMGKTLEEARKKITSPLDVAKKAVMDLFRAPAESLEEAEKLINRSIMTYTTEQERLRLEAEAKLRKAAEAEEAKIRAEKERQERVWRDKQEAAQKEAERLAKAGKAEEAAKAQAEADRAAQKAEERREQAAEVQVVAPTLASNVQKVAGLSYRDNWSAEVTDLMTLVRAVAEGKASVNFLLPNSPALNAQARTTRDSMIVPGVKFVCEKIPVGR